MKEFQEFLHSEPDAGVAQSVLPPFEEKFCRSLPLAFFGMMQHPVARGVEGEDVGVYIEAVVKLSLELQRYQMMSFHIRFVV